jgi:WD40 repeat protein
LTSVEFGRDSRLDAFVCGTLAGSVRVYHPATAESVLVVTPHTDQVLSVAVGPAGPRSEPVIVSGGADRTVRVWAARTGWPLLHLDGHTDLVTVVALGELDGRAVVASGGYDQTVLLWDAGTGAELGRLATPGSSVYALAVGDGVVVTGGYDDAVRVFQAGDLRLATGPVPGLVTSVAVGVWQGIDVVVAAGAEAGVRCWALTTGEPLPVSAPAGPPLAVAFGPVGELWAIGPGGISVIDPVSPG